MKQTYDVLKNVQSVSHSFDESWSLPENATVKQQQEWAQFIDGYVPTPLTALEERFHNIFGEPLVTDSEKLELAEMEQIEGPI